MDASAAAGGAKAAIIPAGAAPRHPLMGAGFVRPCISPGATRGPELRDDRGLVNRSAATWNTRHPRPIRESAMKLRILTLIATATLAALCTPAGAALKPGDAAPDFTTEA